MLCPLDDWLLPRAHGSHSMDPGSAATVPALHKVHEELPEMSVKVPREQLEHDDVPVRL